MKRKAATPAAQAFAGLVKIAMMNRVPHRQVYFKDGFAFVNNGTILSMVPSFQELDTLCVDAQGIRLKNLLNIGLSEDGEWIELVYPSSTSRCRLQEVTPSSRPFREFFAPWLGVLDSIQYREDLATYRSRSSKVYFGYNKIVFREGFVTDWENLLASLPSRSWDTIGFGRDKIVFKKKQRIHEVIAPYFPIKIGTFDFESFKVFLRVGDVFYSEEQDCLVLKHGEGTTCLWGDYSN